MLNFHKKWKIKIINDPKKHIFLNVFKQYIFFLLFWGLNVTRKLVPICSTVISRITPEKDLAVNHTIVDSANHSMRQGVLPL